MQSNSRKGTLRYLAKVETRYVFPEKENVSTLKLVLAVSRAPAAQSVTMLIVNPGVVSLNPNSAKILSTFDKSHYNKRHSSFTNGLTVNVDKQQVT